MIRIVVFAIVMSFLLHPIGAAGAVAHMHSDSATHAEVQHSFGQDHDSRTLEQKDGLVKHDHSGGVCCSTSGMCIAILIVQSQVCQPLALDCEKHSVVRSPSAHIVDTPLHPPIHLS